MDEAESVAPEDRRDIKWPLYYKAMTFGQSSSEKARVTDYLKKLQHLATRRFSTPADDAVSDDRGLRRDMLTEDHLDGSGKNAVAVGTVTDTCRLSRSTSAGDGVTGPHH